MAERSAGFLKVSRIDGGRTRASRLRRLSCAVLFIVSSRAAAVRADDERPVVRPGPPAWMREAYWYRIHIPTFQNANPAKRQPGVRGDDLAGLPSRIPQLKALGVNALWITGLFDDGQAPG